MSAPIAPARGLLLAACLAIVLAGASACGRAGRSPSPEHGGAGAPGRFEVVAAENFWGSIAAQLGGSRATVHSIIANPSTDPHSYVPDAADARTLATASMVIVNGLGYDDWASQLLRASAEGGRVVLDVGQLLRLGAGANPHRWYFPADVNALVRQIVTDYDRVDPADAPYFATRERRFQTEGLARYDQLRKEIRARYAGVPVGYSESIFEGLGADLGLRLMTPRGFAKAIAEGTDVSAADKAAVDAQARAHQIKVWVFNSQNATPDVQRVNQLARERRIPIATITETLSPASASFQQWQVGELEGLLRALHQATGR